ncbi:unnamed protein product [Mytilus coruscus]|uniref:Tyr recombinase domain-containing protein n=1 Tax=Mytilus coruscus TaxID=42192 RepID=A0A6J8E768_MYTCO|nr:unnamed protein product [Mytilus coruscus]
MGNISAGYMTTAKTLIEEVNSPTKTISAPNTAGIGQTVSIVAKVIKVLQGRNVFDVERFLRIGKKRERRILFKKSMISIRYGIQKHIAKIREFDVVNDPAFKPANVIFNAMLVKLKGMRLAAQNHKSPRLRQSDKLKPGDDIWYEKIPVGRNTLGNKMKDMSEQFGLSKKYTNHCLRTTAITLLDQDGFEARDIMAVSGHRSENSIRSYSRTDEGKKRKCQVVSVMLFSKSVAPATKVSKDDRADLHLAVPRLDNAEQNNINPVLQDQRGPVDLETDLADMDFLELSSSQEHVLMQSLSEVTTNNKTALSDNSVKTIASRCESTSRVLTERRLNVPNNLVFHNVNNLHIHYH